MATDATTATQTATQTGVEETQVAQTQSAMPESFEKWLDGQDEPIKALVSKRFEALDNTVKATRDERDTFSKQLKALAKTQADGSEVKKQLDEAIKQLETTEHRASFLEEAIKPEIECKNPRAAWVLAEADGLFDKKGFPDWAAIKAAAPELFGKTIANANAANGRDKPPAKQNNMNDFIRNKGRS